MASVKESVENAETALKTSLFKWNPDFFTAALNYEKAAKLLLKQNEMMESAKFSLLASKYYVKVDSMVINAAKCEENAKDAFFREICKPAGLLSDIQQLVKGTTGTNAEQTLEYIKEALACTERAVSYYLNELNISKAAECEGNTANQLWQVYKSGVAASSDSNDTKFLTQTTMELYIRAIKRIKQMNGNKVAFLTKFLESAFSFSVEIKKYQEGLEILQLSFEIYSETQRTAKKIKVLLNKVLIGLVRRDVVQARKSYSDALQDNDFLNSSECVVAESLTRACENGLVQDWQALLKNPVLFYVDVNLRNELESMFSSTNIQNNDDSGFKDSLNLSSKADKSDLDFLC